MLSILIANVTLAGFTGTELVVRDLAIGFKKLGHHPMVYSPRLGGISEQIIAEGIEVVADLALLSKTPDIIHGNHHVESMQAMLRFPTVPALFVCHDRTAWHSIPPQFFAILKYGAVSAGIREQLAQDDQLPLEKIHTLYNWVDTARFKPRRPLPKFPKRALVFSSYATNDSLLDKVKQACAQCKITLDIVGFGVGNGVTNPEAILGKYALVFAKDKCALEAMATGCAVILYDIDGLGEMVTIANKEKMREGNFGMEVLKTPIPEVSNIVREIKKFNAEDAAQVSQFIRQEAALDESLKKYLMLYADIITQWQKVEPVETNAALADYMHQQLVKMAQLRARLGQPFAMSALSIEESLQLSLTGIDCPKTVTADNQFVVEVLLKNASRRIIASYMPCPLHFSYHWFYAGHDQYFLTDEIRTPIEPWLGARKQAKYDVLIRPPSSKGLYRLVITLVQDTVRWFDMLPEPVRFAQDIEVV